MSLLLLLLMLGGCAYVDVSLDRGVKGIEEKVIEGQGRAKIAVIDVSGIISLGPVGLERFSKEPPMIPRIREELRAVARDPAVAALVVRIDSPGGSVTASDVIHHELTALRREKEIPVVACIMDKGLSGGYYVALAADRIVAHPTALVGGVGVISFRINVDELLQRWGIEVATVQSGGKKDFWSPLHAARPGEMAWMQGVTDHLQKRFLSLLDASRDLSPAVRAEVAEGGAFTADRAERLGLVDATGYLDDALLAAREMAGVEEARVVIYRRPGAYAESVYARAGLPLQELMLLEGFASDLLTPALRYQVLP